MKRKNATTKNATTKQNNPHKWDLQAYEFEDVIKDAKTFDNGRTEYPLAHGLILSISDAGDDRNDYGFLSVCDFSIDITIMEGKDGTPFICFPSYRKNDGSYKQMVRCYSHDIHELIKKVLDHHYNG